MRNEKINKNSWKQKQKCPWDGKKLRAYLNEKTLRKDDSKDCKNNCICQKSKTYMVEYASIFLTENFATIFYTKTNGIRFCPRTIPYSQDIFVF